MFNRCAVGIDAESATKNTASLIVDKNNHYHSLLRIILVCITVHVLYSSLVIFFSVMKTTVRSVLPAFSPLAFAIALALPSQYTIAAPAPAAADRVTLPTVEVRTDETRNYPQVPPEIESNRILTGKKAQRVELDEQPAIADNNLRQVFARLPGLLVSEQPIPTHQNINYRGLGDPHESEFVLFAVDGTPVASDWFGYPTTYYLPSTLRVDKVDFIRGGSALLYGPQPGPVINFITRKPQPGQAFDLLTELRAGEYGFYNAYAQISSGGDNTAWLLAADTRQTDGERDHSGYQVTGVNGVWVYQPDKNQSWEVDVDLYNSQSDEPGRLTLAQYQTNPDQTTSRFNRVWIDRWSISAKHERAFNDSTSLVGKVWHSYLDRFSRRTSTFTATDPLPTSTTFDRQEFTTTGLDLRVLREWGDNHSLSVGTTLYQSDSPRDQLRSTDLVADFGNELRYRQNRDTQYAAVFVENAFRFGGWSLVPAVRFEWLEMSIDETVKLPTLRRPALDRTFSRTEPLFGFGLSRDFADSWQFYGNLSQGYRPMRYDDIGNPTAELAGSNDPDLAYAENIEFGVRGSPIDGLFIDASVFEITLEDKIEQVLINATDIERINSGDARHRGVEVAAEYDVLKASNPSNENSLLIYLNGAYLDAEITASTSAALIGKIPAFAPETILRSGLIWRNAQGIKVALTGTYVAEQFWQDSNTARGTAATFVPALIPSFSVWDLSAEWPLSEKFTLLGGVNNLADRQYYSRVRTDGIEPAPGRHAYVGVRVGL